MTPEHWRAMETAANRAEGSAWLAFGVGVACGALVLFVLWGTWRAWRDWQERTIKERTFGGRRETWR